MGTGPDPKGEAVDGAGRRVAIVASRFNATVTDAMVAGARAALRDAGVADGDVHVHRVPGAFEIAPTIRQVLAYGGNQVDAIVAIGAIVRGETPHFDHLSTAVTVALQDLANEINVPLAFGVITCDTPEQAAARADADRLDKGGEAARAALAQAAEYDRIRESRATTPRGFKVP